MYLSTDNAATLRARLTIELAHRPPAEAIRTAYDAVMPQVDANHYTVVADPASPAITRIVDLLADPDAPPTS
jgi:effector-binding domain-containing protein